MSSVSINRQTLVWMYENGYTMKEMVDYLNANYGSNEVKFTTKKVKELYLRINLDLRKKKRKSFQVDIVDEENEEEEYREEENDIPENIFVTN